jgi:hypothetical protein
MDSEQISLMAVEIRVIAQQIPSGGTLPELANKLYKLRGATTNLLEAIGHNPCQCNKKQSGFIR